MTNTCVGRERMKVTKWLLGLLASVALVACASTPPLEWNGVTAISLPEGVYGIRNPDWSPDDAHVVYAGSEIMTGWSGSLYVQDVASDTVSPFHSVEENRFPKWSSDSGRVIFGDSTSELQLLEQDQVTPSGTQGYAAVWSPDGQQLAVFRSPTDEHPVSEVVVHDLVTDQEKRILALETDVANFGGIDWSQTTDLIAVSMGQKTVSQAEWTPEIYILEPTESLDSAAPVRTGYSPSWGPDGIWYVILQDDVKTGLTAIVFARADGTCEIRAKSASRLSEVAWSSGGDRLIVVYDHQMYVVDIRQAFGIDPNDLQESCPNE